MTARPSPLRIRVIGLLVLVVGCTTPTNPPTTDTSDSDTPNDTADPIPEVITEIPEASLSAETVAAEIEALFANGMVGPMLPRKAYLESFEGRDDSCPGGGGYNLPGNFQGCTADSGWLYAGYTEYSGSVDPNELSDFGLLADCYMIDPDGNWFVAAGNLSLERTGDENGGSVLAEVNGTYSYPAVEGWIGSTGAAAIVEIEGNWSTTGWTITFDGSTTNGTTSVRLDGISTNSTECDGQPVGTYELRDENGFWYALAATDCGCGMVTYADKTELGEACVDLAATVAAFMASVKL